jgi:ribose transport system permease protein
MTTTTATTTARVGLVRSRSSAARLAAQGTQLLGVGGFFILMVIFFTIESSRFFVGSNAVNILSNLAPLAVVALGQSLVLISGGFDLSVAGAAPLGGIIYVSACNHGSSAPEAIALAVLSGMAIGVVNGGIITRLGINPLITTLATVSITEGLAFTVTNGVTITLNNPNKAGLDINFLGIPEYVWVMIVMSVATFVLLRYSVFGRMLYSMGGNREAARLAGLRTDLITVSAYVISGGFAAFAGVILAEQLLAGAPTVASNEGLQSITAVILGGASLTGGSGGIPGSLLGVAVLGVVSNGLALMQVQTFYQQIATGAILLLAVGLGQLRGVVEHAVWARSREVQAAAGEEPAGPVAAAAPSETQRAP